MKIPLKTAKFKFYKLEIAIVLTGMVLMVIGNILGSTGENTEKIPNQELMPSGNRLLAY